MEILRLPTLLLGYLIQKVKTKDVISLGDTCKSLRDIAKYELNKRKEAYFERFTYPGTQWNFKGMWHVPYEVIKDLPEDKKPSLYKRVGNPGYPFEKAVKDLDEAYDRGDTGTYQLGWTSLTHQTPLKFIKANWEKYPWCRHGMTNHPEFNWEDAIQHPERYSFSTLSLNHPDAYKIAIQYPHLPWDKHFLQNHNPVRFTELTIERMIKIGLQPTYEVYDYPCVSIEDILSHPELNWQCISSLSHHRELTIDILKKYPKGLQPDGWDNGFVTRHIPIQDILENPYVFPWDPEVFKERLKQEKKRYISIDEIVSNPNNDWDLRYLIHTRSIQDLLKLWDHPEIKQKIIHIYEFDYEYEREQRTFGHDLSRHKEFQFSLIFERIHDTDLQWDWDYLTEETSLEFIQNNPTLPWCNYSLSRRKDITWEFVKKNLTTFEWSWENLGYNENMFKPDL